MFGDKSRGQSQECKTVRIKLPGGKTGYEHTFTGPGAASRARRAVSQYRQAYRETGGDPDDLNVKLENGN